MERLLVTGVDYPLGANLALALAEHFEVLGLCDERSLECDQLTAAVSPPHEPKLASELARDWKPSWIIHCGAASLGSWDAPADCGQTACRVSAAEVAGHWARRANDLTARLTVVTSDAVFDGPLMFHDEDSPAAATGSFADSTRAVERTVVGSGALVVRTHAYGWSPIADHAGFAEQTWQTLASGGGVANNGRCYATPILATDLAQLLLRAYRARLDGLYHLSGAERTNPYRFACELAHAAGFRAGAAASRDSLDDASTHSETSLSSQRARRVLESATPLLREGLTRLADQHRNGWHQHWRSTVRAAEMAA